MARRSAEISRVVAPLFDRLKLPSSPYINQFLSADTIVPDPTNPQDLNRFSYVRNNPLKYTDPSGHDPWWCQSASCAQSYLTSMANAPSQSGNGNRVPDSDDPVDLSNASELTELNEELLDFCILHPYASSCTFALPPAQCDLTPVIGPPGTIFTAGGCQFTGYETYTDWDNMDWGGLFFNGLGVAGGFALLIGTIGIITLPTGLAVYEGTQIAGFAYNVYQLDTEAITVDIVLEVASQTNLGSQLVPGLGSILDFAEMGEIWADAQVVVPIYEPYPRPLIFPPMSP